MIAIINAALDRPRTVLLTLLLILIAGASVYVTIPKESDPDITIPNIYVSMGYEGISPDDAMRLLLRPMEQELRGIENVEEMRSTAYEGGAPPKCHSRVRGRIRPRYRSRRCADQGRRRPEKPAGRSG